MSDTRARVPLGGKTVNLAQLAAEVGAPLTASDAEVVVADADSTVTAAGLRAALDAHTPAAEPDPDAEFRKAVEAATSLAALKDALLGTTGPGAEPRQPTGA
jgi:hypothetical protein